MLQEKRFDWLLSLCRGKYSKKLAELRKRHDTSLNLNVECFEISLEREWIVQSVSDSEDFYNVTRTQTECNSCDLRCINCNACIHDFLYTCADMGNKYNMCKHIHYICTKYPHKVVDVGTASEDHLLVIDEDERRRVAQAEADAHMTLLSRSFHSNTDVSVNRDVATKLAMETLNLIQTITNNDELLSIIDSLRAIRPRMEAVSASR